MPVGGICTGQLYLTGDGRLSHWDIFNDSAENAHPGTHYQVMPQPVRIVQQGFALRVRTGEQTITRALDQTGLSRCAVSGRIPDRNG